MSESSLPSSMKLIKDRFEVPSFQQSLRGFSKNIQFSLTDISGNFVFSLVDGKLTAVEKKSLPDPDIIITTTDKEIESIMKKTSNPVSAYMTGKIKVKGSMEDLMRLQNLMN